MAFEQFSPFLEWALWQQTGLSATAYYLDEFLCRFLVLRAACASTEVLSSMPSDLAVLVATEKTKGLSLLLTFWEIEQITNLPDSRVCELSHFGGRREVT